MAIQKPYNINIAGTVQPAEEDIYISWSVSGGIQYAKSITIKDNATASVVFTLAKTSSFSTNYTLPANTLLNGKQYKIEITVWDEVDNFAVSDAYIFETSSRPVISISPIGTVNAPSYTFSFQYTQAESVAMRSWIAYLYDSNQVMLKNSGIQTTPTLSYLFDGFESNKDYFIEIQATSAKNLIGTSGLVAFSVQYEQPKMLSAIEAENIENSGIKITWNPIQIIGAGNNYLFIDNEKVDITAPNSNIYFDQGFRIDNDFSMRLLIENVPDETYNIVTNMPIIGCETSPSNIDALWLESPGQIEETTYSLVASSIVPTTPASTTLWLYSTQVSQETTLVVNADLNEPQGTNIVWLDLGANLDNLTFVIVNEDNYTIRLRRYNGTFYLYKNNDIVSSLTLTATNYCLVIKRINEVWTIEGGAITP